MKLSADLGRFCAALAAIVLNGAVGGAALADCKVERLIELPITMSGTRPLVSTKINGVDAQFLIDSGAFYSMISRAEAKARGLRIVPAPFNLRVEGIGGEADVEKTTVKTFSLAGADLPKVEFLVGGSEVGAGAIGFLGQNLLRLGDDEFDLANGAFRMFKATGCDNAVMVYWSKTIPYSVVPIERPDGPHLQAIGAAYVNGHRIRVMFDTGASRSFLSRSAAERAGISITSPGVVPGGRSGGIGRRTVQTWIAPIASFKIGDEEIRNTRLRIGDTDLPEVDMLLGADFFLSHRVYLSQGQHKIYFTYNGGPVFRLDRQPSEDSADEKPTDAKAASATEADAPKDAEGYSLRGAALAARQDFAKAIEDLDKACALAPAEPRYFYQRAQVHLAMRQPFLARADLDQVIKLKSDDVPALIERAALRRTGGERAGAVADLDAADAAAPKESGERLRMAAEYEELGRLPKAIANFESWIAVHPDDSRLPSALAGLCWADAMWGEFLDKAGRDCDRARQTSKLVRAEAGRGLVRLRRGDFDGAIAEFNLALAQQPKHGWALYGRGLAEQRKGLKAEGDADIAAALAIQPKLTQEAERRGFVTAPPPPPAGPPPPALAPSATPKSPI
jgi:tetratricopeptide (TPR) repeat protein/predicted aspartyl protease